jgi:hypothetical protein
MARGLLKGMAMLTTRAATIALLFTAATATTALADDATVIAAAPAAPAAGALSASRPWTAADARPAVAASRHA